MLNILLCCSAGMSSSMLVKKMRIAAKERGIEAEIWATSQTDLPDYKDKADVILIGPQIRFVINDIKKEVRPNLPVYVIDLMDYGTMNGKKVLDITLEKMGLK